MRVLITGGTGFIGTKLVGALVARGDAPVVLTRGAPREGGPIAYVRYDPTTVDPRVLDGVDAVVNLAGAGITDKRWTEEREALLLSSRVDTTSSLVKAIARASDKPKVLVSASAVGIYGMRRDDVVLGEDAPHGDDILGRIGDAWEAAAREASAAGVRVALPRIGVVLDRGGGALAKMMAPFRAGVGGPLGRGTQYMSWIHAKDVVRGLLYGIDTPGFDGPYNLCAPTPVTMNDFARALGDALGRPSALRVPGIALKLALGEGLAELLLTGQRAVPARLTAAGFRFEFPDLAAALTDALRR